jgi:hypothetical protein
MNINILLEKLIEIEQSIGVETNSTLRKQVHDMQDTLLAMQKEMVEQLRKEPRRFVFEAFPSSTYAA